VPHLQLIDITQKKFLNHEVGLRQQKRLQRRYEQSSLKQRIEIEDLILNAERGIDRREILYLLENHWMTGTI